MKTRIYLLILSIFYTLPSLAQTQWNQKIKDPSVFYDIRNAYLEFIERAKQENTWKEEYDDEQTKFRRWENFMEPRVFPSGKFPSPSALWKEMRNSREYINRKSVSTMAANWTSLEPSSGFPQDGYAGRANCIAFHPNDSNIMFVGTPAGGLWKTIDGGQVWFPLTDNLPSLGVSEIAINPLNPDIMYMATGDKDGAYFISNPYSYGLLKSTDGGTTWDTTGLQFIFDDQMTIQRLLIHPSSPNILFAAVSGVNGIYRGIWKSIDDGATWLQMYGGAKYDLEFHPANPAIIYASAYTYLLRSTDTGSTWTTITSPVLPSTGITSAKIAVTPAQPDFVYVQYLNPANGSTYGLYKSADAGITWVQKNNTAITTQGGYDWILAASPVDTGLLLMGGQYLYRSTDDGVTSTFTFGGHADNHGMDYRPGSSILFNCNDGGVYKSYDNGMNWINLNQGFQTFQYYRLGCSYTNPGFILTGAQDNGTWRHNFTSWANIGWGDGMECLIDYTDTSIYYTCSQYGSIWRYGSGIGTFTNPPTAGSNNSCAWVTPYLIHPTDPTVLFFGAKDIYRTNNRGNSWTNYSTNLTINDNVGGGMLRNMAISESHPDSVLYAVSYVVVYKTADAGASWQDVTSNLPVSAGCYNCSALSDIVIHPLDPNTAWVTFSGFSNGNHVYKTTDGGVSWTNISGTLPPVPVNCIVYENNSADALYIGTDIGVFYLDSTLTDWIPYMTGLPNVPVQELEMHYPTGTIRAATFGRGLWESNLYGINTSLHSVSDIRDGISIYPNPSGGKVTILVNKNLVNSRLEIFDLMGSKVYEAKVLNSSMELNLEGLSKGLFYCKFLSPDGNLERVAKVVLD